MWSALNIMSISLKCIKSRNNLDNSANQNYANKNLYSKAIRTNMRYGIS